MVKILDFSVSPLTQMGLYASICTGGAVPEKYSDIGRQCIESGHGRALEFVDVTLELSEYSARAIRELYTHIVGTSRLQESTRYVNCEKFNYFVPPAIEANIQALAVYMELMDIVQAAYKTLTDCGIAKEDAANMLPLGMYTKIVLKINARALLHLAEERLCKRAYHEIRELVRDIKAALSEVDDQWAEIAALMKPKCKVHGYCAEARSCGMTARKGESGNGQA